MSADELYELVSVAPGQYIQSGQPLAHLVDTTRLIVRGNVLESELNAVSAGDSVIIQANANIVSGRVASISPFVDPKTHTARVNIELKPVSESIKDGMNATIEIFAQTNRSGFRVPVNAVLERNDQHLIFVVRDGLAKWIYVAKGEQNGRSFRPCFSNLFRGFGYC